jgi:hypothetical protein
MRTYRSITLYIRCLSCCTSFIITLADLNRKEHKIIVCYLFVCVLYVELWWISVFRIVFIYIYKMLLWWWWWCQSVLRDQVVPAETHVTNSQSSELASWVEESVAYPDLGVCDQLNVCIVPWHESWSPPFLYYLHAVSRSLIYRSINCHTLHFYIFPGSVPQKSTRALTPESQRLVSLQKYLDICRVHLNNL